MGGNIFKGKTSSIKKEYISVTLDNYFKELQRVFPKKANIFNIKKFKPVGSVGKKPLSGDIDLAVDISSLVDKTFSDKSIKEWDIEPQDVKDEFEKLRKRARTATQEQLMMKALLKKIVAKINTVSPNIYCDEKKITNGNIFGLYPQYDEHNNKLDTGVQIDWMVGNLKWLEFSYYSNTYKGVVKGLHRTQLMLAMFDHLGLSFNHVNGVKDKDTQEILATDPQGAIDILNERFKIKLTKSILADYFKLSEYIEKKLKKSDYDHIIDIYLKILDRTRCDIPENLQDEWKKRKNKLGLTGKFLPEDSMLIGEMALAETGIKAFSAFMEEK